jgi:hypothetical protein
MEIGFTKIYTCNTLQLTLVFCPSTENLRFMLKEVLDYVNASPGKKLKRSTFVHKIWINSTFSPALPIRLTQFTF